MPRRMLSIGGGSVSVAGGSGTANRVAKFSNSTTLADSGITDDGTTVKSAEPVAPSTAGDRKSVV